MLSPLQPMNILSSGIVRDRTNKNKLENVTVSVEGSSIGTVTNAEGGFSLKIPHLRPGSKLELSHIGYQNAQFAIAVSGNTHHLSVTIWMTPVTQQLDEVVVYGGDARRIVEEALKKIPVNYPAYESMLSTFYRETIQKRHRYIGVSEAMMDVYKTAYTDRDMARDKVQLIKARRKAFSPKHIFYDVVEEYWNEDYWKNYNIIESTETLDKTMKKLKRQLPQDEN